MNQDEHKGHKLSQGFPGWDYTCECGEHFTMTGAGLLTDSERVEHDAKLALAQWPPLSR